jgi:hypothetical protein
VPTAFCIDDKTGDGKDTGCDQNNRICVDDGKDPDKKESKKSPGDSCAFCVNDMDGEMVDSGCSDSSPLCVDGDFSSTANFREGDKCVVCVDDEIGGGTDTGCGDDDDTPICVKDGKDPDKKNSLDTPGDSCAFCVNDMDDDMVDSGCTEKSPLCLSPNGSINPGADFRAGSKCVPKPTPAPKPTPMPTPAPKPTPRPTPAPKPTSKPTSCVGQGEKCSEDKECCYGYYCDTYWYLWKKCKAKPYYMRGLLGNDENE